MRNLYQQKLALASLPAIILAAGLFLLTFQLGKQPLFLLLNQDLGSAADHFFRYFTEAGNGAMWVVVLGVVLFVLKRKDAVWLIVAGFAISTLLTQSMKHLVFPGEFRPARAIAEVARVMDAASRDRFFSLVGAPGFAPWFAQVTPMEEVGLLALGSRPARRGLSVESLEDLRAIPWVFAWSQNRSGLTGWYGVGTALARGIETHGRDTLADMARDWPFFAAMLDDIEMLLAKSDLAIFERYSRLAGVQHDAFFPGIAEEFERTVDTLLALRDRQQLLQDDYRLRLSIRLRNPYVDPISLLQVDLLRRWRDGGREDEALLEALVTTVNGIAAGIQNTG